jgi:hypothetical protein
MTEIIKGGIEGDKPDIIYTEKVTAIDNILTIERTPDKIVPLVESIDILEVKDELARSLNALAQWQDKVDNLQATIDKYELNLTKI